MNSSCNVLTSTVTSIKNTVLSRYIANLFLTVGSLHVIRMYIHLYIDENNRCISTINYHHCDNDNLNREILPFLR